ncbi:MAG: virulence RhuM family protein [Lachnospiraceae bacterium]|nr:virulence RhuM family protein [Lachnospiraceae bacterium]
MIIFKTDDDKISVDVRFDEETVWLSLDQMAELFERDKSTISRHIKNVFDEGELEQSATVVKFATVQIEGSRQVERQIEFYNLDVIISVGYRVKSLRGTQFRQWATKRLNEYIRKGFTMDDERLKEIGGGGYWKELLARIRDIRSSEKVMYRQVLDLYATAIDYDAKAEISRQFFQMVQNKLHYAAHGKTAAEVIYYRVDSEKPFAGLKSFKGGQPTQAEAMIAKNFLEEKELLVLNNLVSAYFDLAEVNAIEQRAMKMSDYVNELDNILRSTNRRILTDLGKISSEDAKLKAKEEIQKYKARTLTQVEKDYLNAIKEIEKTAKKKSKNADGGGNGE